MWLGIASAAGDGNPQRLLGLGWLVKGGQWHVLSWLPAGLGQPFRGVQGWWRALVSSEELEDTGQGACPGLQVASW